MVRPSRFTKHLAVLAAAFAAGCSGPLFVDHPRVVEHNSDVANVYVTTLPPMDFHDIQKTIAIHHELSAADCRNLAGQTTGSSLFQYISQIALGATVALPTHTVSDTTTATNGSLSTTSTTTRGSAGIPSGSGAPTNGVTPSSLTPDLTKPAPSLGMDGEAQIMGGTAICQTAALVEQQIASAKLPEDYDAYVVTFQVNVQPKARDLSYDTDINIELWPTDKESSAASGVSQTAWARPPIMIKPLIITDVLESTSIARSMMAARQFAASLSGVLPSMAALNAGGSSSNAQLDEALGADRNAVLTMGNPSANTIRIHLGAPSSGSSKFAMVPRTFNISTLVLMAKAKAQNDIVFVSRSAFRSTDPSVTQQPTTDFSRDSRLALAARTKTLLCYYQMPLADNAMCGGQPDTCNTAYNATKHQLELTEREANNPDMILDVLRQVDLQNRKFLDTCLVPPLLAAPCNDSDSNCKAARSISNEVRRIRLYSDLAEIKAGSDHSTGIIALPVRKAAPAYPLEKQLVSVVDDGKSATTVVLLGGANLDGGKLQAYATVASKTCQPSAAQPTECILLPTSTDVSTDGSTLTLTFPSLSAMKPAPATLATITLATSEQGKPTQHKDCANDETNKGIFCYGSFFTPPSDTEGSSNYTASVSASTPVILADASGSGFASFTVNVDKVGTGGKKAAGAGAGSAFLSVKGATVTSADTTSSVFSFGSKGISVTSSGTAPVLLGNLTPGQLVTVQVTGPDKTALSQPFTLYVVPQTSHK